MLLTKTGIRSAGALGMLLVAAGAANAGALVPQDKASANLRMTTNQAQRLLAARSARFVENKGQWDSQAKFLARTGSLDLWFTDQGIRYDQYLRGGGAGKDAGSQVVDMTFAGGSKAVPLGRNKLRAKIDYFTSSGNAKSVGAYGELYSHEVVRGVDMRSYFDHGKPRYDLIVAPGQSPKAIKLAFKGDNGLSIAKGDLRVGTKLGGFSNGRPVAYQIVNGKHVTVAANWKLIGKHMAGFSLGAYDTRKPLVIDPLIFGTYFGGNDNADEVRAVVADANKNVYFTGATRAARFPVLNPGFPTSADPQGLNINVGDGGGASDTFVSRVAGDVYTYDYSAFFGGSVDDVGQFIKFDPAGNLWVAGTTGSSNFPTNDRGNVQFLFSVQGATLPFATNRNKATFRLSFRGRFGAKLPFNATPAEVAANLNAFLTPLVAPGVTPVRSVRSQGGGNIADGDTYRIELDPSLPFPIVVQSTFVGPVANPANFGLPASFRTLGVSINQFNVPVVDNTLPTQQQVRAFGSDPTSGNYTLTFTNQDATPVAATTTNIQVNANTNAVQTVLNALANHTNETAVVDTTNVTPAGVDTNSQFRYRIRFASTATPPIAGDLPENLIAVNSNLQPNNCQYTTRQVTDSYVLHLVKNGDGSFSPAATSPVLIFGSDDSDELTGFDVWQKLGATSSDDEVEFVLSGSTTSKLLNSAKAYPGGSVGYLARYTWSTAAGYTLVVPATDGNVNNPQNDLPYVISRTGFQTDVRGVALDSDGAAYIGGTIFASGNFTTGPTSTAFFTTNGIFNNGNQLRNEDAFVRKYNRNGSVSYSGVLGGHGFDEAGGIGAGLDGSRVNTGSAVAVDQFDNLYITGVCRSFDFPRTRGVYGEVFSDTANVFVTKINAAGSTLLYSTNLKDELGDSPIIANAAPAGIAVDSRGYAYITGNLRPTAVNFPGPLPGDPNQPGSSTYGSIDLPGAPTEIPDNVWTGPTGSEFPTTEGFLTVLNPTATGVPLTTYLGGFLDDFVYAPAVSPFGDVFTAGWTDSSRGYVRVSSTGSPTIYNTNASFPLITNLAIKQSPDQSNQAFSATLGYGIWNTNPNAAGGFGAAPPFFVGAAYSRDGFIAQFRVDAASISNLTFDPTSIPGGLGASTTGSVTLNRGAPSGGGQIVVTLPNGTGTASLQPLDVNPDADTLTVNVAEGATTATFKVYSKPVSVNTSVSVRATFSGTFKETAFQVVPWLQRLQLSNDTMVGGDPTLLRGTITLAAPAPAGGVEISLSSDPDKARVLGVPFSVPAGQTSAPFDIESDGVDANTVVRIQATLLGVTKSADLTLTPATLQSITITPDTVAGGSTATAVLTLNGKAGDLPYVVNLTSSDPSVTISPSTVTIAPQKTTSEGTTITITTSPVGADKTVTIRARHEASTGHAEVERTAVLRVQALSVASLTLNPTTVDSGATSTATLSLATSAPAGGARVYVASLNLALATVIAADGSSLPSDSTGSYVLVPAGTKTATFKVKARYVGVSSTVGITAAQGIGTPRQATLTIRPLVYTLSFSPTTVTGGSGTVTGTVTLATAPTETLTFTVASGNTTVIPNPVPTTVTIAAGSRTGTFTLRPTTVSAATNVTITVTFNGGSKSGTVQVNPVGLLSVVPVQTTIRSGTGFLDLNVNFNGVTADDAVMTISFNLESVFVGPRSVTVPAGRTSFPLHYSTNRVSRSQNVTITVTYKGTTKSTTVTVAR